MNLLAYLTFLVIQFSTVVTPLLLEGCSNSTCGDCLVSEKKAPSDLNKKILEILNASKPCESLDDCDTVEVSLVPKSRTKASTERVLVVDGGIRLAAYTRYKSRVLDHLIANEDGKYVSNPQRFKVPKPVFEVLSNLLDEQNPSTPAFHLNDVAREFVKHLMCVDSNSAHGSEIFGTLADLNPEGEFVIAQMIDSYRSGFCEFYTSCDWVCEEESKEQKKIPLDQLSIKELFQKAEAIKSGHFEIKSGHHTSEFWEKALLFQEPSILNEIAQRIAEKVRESGATVVLSPAVGGDTGGSWKMEKLTT